MEIFQNYLQPLIDFLRLHPHWAGVITFFVVFCEAMAVIGVIVPGSVTMTAIGVLMGIGVIPMLSNFIWAICGAILGDYISYILGVYYKNRIHRMWPFNKHPKLLEKSEKFFHHHGGKSVLIGRFIGPMRAMIPMIAGVFKMPLGRFLLAAIPSASIWAVLYIIPGVLLGSLSLKLPPKIATQFLLAAMVSVIATWSLVWLAQHFFKRLCAFLDNQIETLWLFLQKHRATKWLPNLLSAQHRSDNHKQLGMFFGMVITAGIFIVILYNSANEGILTIFDQPIYNLLQSLRTTIGDKIMVVVSFLAEPRALLIAQAVFLVWLALKKHWYAALHILALAGLLVTSVDTIKVLAQISRPDGVLLFLHDYSFPSGHVTFCVGVYGFLTMMFTDGLKKNLRWIMVSILSGLIMLVMLSRLYLGAHWLTDVVGGLFLGLTILFLVTISYRRHHSKNTSPVITSIIAICVFCIVLVFYAMRVYQTELIMYYTPEKPSAVIELKNLEVQITNGELKEIPLYRNDRFGNPIDAFNIRWVGDLKHIERSLVAAGWVNYPSNINTKEIIRRVTMRATTKQKVPFITQLYNNHREALLVTKNGLGKNPTLILRLWNSNIMVKDSPRRLWLGVVNYYQPKEHKSKKFIGATHEFISYLHGYKWQKVHYPLDKQPPEMRNLGWRGEVLVIN